MAKHENYVEAHKVQVRAQQRLQAETEKYLQQRSLRINNMLGQLQAKQNSEMNALRQKIVSGIE